MLVNLIEEAHSIFDELSIFEVIDLDRDAATTKVSQLYKTDNIEMIRRYLDIVDDIKALI
ncbi:hypothetical protein [Desulfosediminicola flagellatus]|uniref:hypothetical protein n=1 Tax=Desulfosediminicola flagellatus TaxID=2569541 RepID=UPI0010AD2C6E|nr:hypothetical protein [Desulfosediminicola flagellatus]